MSSNEINETDGLSTDAIINAASLLVTQLHRDFPAKHLDIGSGSGILIKILNKKNSLESEGCDYTKDLIQDKSVPITVVDLNNGKLPFEDSTFDIVTCTETIEHLENYRSILKEAFRILRKGGTLVVTTPNILNLKSRIRFLFFGFYNLFGPLHFKESALHSTGGHITPIGLFYLNHSLVDAGFEELIVNIDKRQSTSLFWLFWLFLPIKLYSWLAIKKEARKYKTIDEHNHKFVVEMNTIDILTGRTIVVGCKKISDS